MVRADIPDARLVGMVAASVAAMVLWFVLRPWLPLAWREPGSPALYLTGVAGALLLLVPAAFALAKRSGAARPRAWFNAHVACACAGSVLIAIHSAGFLRRPPALLLAALVLLAAIGVWARVRGSRRMAATFASKVGSFRAPDAAARERLRELLSQKRRLLALLEPAADEGTFSVSLPQLLRAPRLALAYRRLEREESRLLGTRAAAGALAGWWRPLHLAVAWLFVLGVVVHVLTVTFFAGYVADYGPVSWWHLRAW